jgi:hypothetical protein
LLGFSQTKQKLFKFQQEHQSRSCYRNGVFLA